MGRPDPRSYWPWLLENVFIPVLGALILAHETLLRPHGSDQTLVAAGVALVELAGGVVSAYDGSALELSSGRLIACTPALQAPLIEGLAACHPLPGRCYGAPELDTLQGTDS